jgi:uncharacterized membrane protein
MKAIRRYWLALLLSAATFAVAGVYYGRLPERIPVHWNLHGVVDAWLPKPAGTFTLPFETLFLTGILIGLAPKATYAAEANSMRRVYPMMVAAIAAFMLYMMILVVRVGIGLEQAVPSYSAIGLGVLLMVLGNYMGKVTRNWIVGVRTPWTLASDEIWSRANRLGGWLLVLAGFVVIISAVLGYGTDFVLPAVIAAAAVPAGYSYVLARRLHGEKRST